MTGSRVGLLCTVLTIGGLERPLEAQIRFPSAVHHTMAPKGRLTVRWIPGDARHAHQLTLDNGKPEEVRTLLQFERSATVYWRQDGKAFAVTSDDLSGMATTWVFWPDNAPDYVHLELAAAPVSLRRPCVPQSEIRVEALGWLNSRTLNVRLQSRDSAGRQCPERLWTYTMAARPAATTSHVFPGSPAAVALGAFIVLRTIVALVLIVLAARHGVPSFRLMLQAASDISLALGCLAFQDPVIAYHLGLALVFTGIYAVGWEIYSTVNDFMEDAADRPAEIPTISAGGLGRDFMLLWRLLGGVPAWYMCLAAAGNDALEVPAALGFVVGGAGLALWQYRRAGSKTARWDLVVIGIGVSLTGLLSLLIP